MGRSGTAAADAFKNFFAKVAPESTGLQSVSVEEPNTQQEGVRAHRGQKRSPQKSKSSKAEDSKATESHQADKMLDDAPSGSTAEECAEGSQAGVEERQVKRAIDLDRE
jgi:hypothetical protein